jgi:MoxR-like ATPase
MREKQDRRLTSTDVLTSIDHLEEQLRTHQYIADRGLATALFLAIKMKRPLFLEGEAGVGKTEVAKVTAKILDTQLIRLQCYEGLDTYHAIYEWNYARQMLQIRFQESQQQKLSESDLFGEEFLLRRPLLQAIDASRDKPAVLLIDEIDRADTEFEAFLLELLSDYQITIPEIGTISATHPPVVVITSNRTREVHDALKRRCIYHWIDYPAYEKELEILKSKTPAADATLAAQVTSYVQQLREDDLYKTPGVAESLDWLNALMTLGQLSLNGEAVENTLGVLLKYRDDVEKVSGKMSSEILERIIAA